MSAVSARAKSFRPRTHLSPSCRGGRSARLSIPNVGTRGARSGVADEADSCHTPARSSESLSSRAIEALEGSGADEHRDRRSGLRFEALPSKPRSRGGSVARSGLAYRPSPTGAAGCPRFRRSPDQGHALAARCREGSDDPPRARRARPASVASRSCDRRDFQTSSPLPAELRVLISPVTKKPKSRTSPMSCLSFGFWRRKVFAVSAA